MKLFEQAKIVLSPATADFCHNENNSNEFKLNPGLKDNSSSKQWYVVVFELNWNGLNPENQDNSEIRRLQSKYVLLEAKLVAKTPLTYSFSGRSGSHRWVWILLTWKSNLKHFNLQEDPTVINLENLFNEQHL